MNQQTKVWTTIELIDWGYEFLSSKGISNAKLEVEWLLCHVLNCKRIDLYVQFEQPLMKNELAQFKTSIKRRIKGEPFQHIIGKGDFYGRDFFVNKDVLIPRPETELIIEILKKKNKNGMFLEIGTGSGCISITLVLENLTNNIIATDISKDALSVAKNNADNFNIKDIDFKIHNFLETKIHSTYDVIISNPPYIGINELENLQDEVKNYDPKIALTDNKDGLEFYRKFSDIGIALLNKNGLMLLEFGGEHQVEAIPRIFEDDNYDIKFHYDIQKNPRIIEVNLLS